MCVPYISNIDLNVFFQIPYTMASRPRHESAARHARGKRPIEPEPSHEREEARTNISLFGSPAEHECYCSNFRKRKVIADRDIEFTLLEGSCLEALSSGMGWLPLVTLREPVYPTLVQIFFDRANVSGSRITSMLQGIEFDLGAYDLFHLLSVPSTGVRVFETKTRPQIDGFDLVAVVQRLIDSDAYGVARL